MASGDQLKNLLLLYRSIAMQYQLGQYTDKALRSILASLNKARERLFDEISYRDIAMPKERVDMVLEELNNLTLGIQAQLSKDIQDAAVVAGEYSFREYDQILSFDGKLAETVGFNFASVSTDQLRAMAVDVPVGGKLLEDWVKDTFERRIIDEIQTAVMADTFQGLSTPKIIRHMENSFGMIRDDAETLVRTYIQSINNQAADAVYKANSDIVNQVEWSATLEVSKEYGRGTCRVCAAYDGKTWAIDEEHPSPPIHPRCRCFLLAKTDTYKNLGLNIPEMKESLRPYTERGEARSIIEAGQFQGQFEDFLKSRSKQYQIDFLGQNRYKLWKDGKIKICDLADENGNEKTLKELPNL